MIIRQSISAYQQNHNQAILDLFDHFKDDIETEYKAVGANPFVAVLSAIEKDSFVSSINFQDLLENDFRKDLSSWMLILKPRWNLTLEKTLATLGIKIK